MKTRLIVVCLILILLAPAKVTESRVSEQVQAHDFSLDYPPATLSTIDQPLPASGQVTYFTHPEFNNILTANVTTPAQNTEEGYIFLAAPAVFYNGTSVILIIDNTGEPVYIKTFPTGFAGDFKKQTINGTDYLTYHLGIYGGGHTSGSSYVLDENYQVVDTWTINNGYGADVHDFLLLDNGHAIQLSYVPTPFDLTPYGGPSNGTIIDNLLQEQDENKNVVFDWVASDHLPIGDSELNLNTTDPVDYLHTNAIAVDNDGNWLVSHRHFSQITKIDRQTGDIIWRMGGVSNEFTFTNDIGFSNQHNINRLPNGNITLFDNGNQHNPSHSRAIEYAVDENAKTVTRVWMYPNDTSEYSSAMGDIQRLANGNSFIGWGSRPKFTEVQDDGTIALEMSLNGLSYRAFRFTWSGTPLEAPRGVIFYNSDHTAVTIYTSWNGATDVTGYDIYAGPTPGTMTLVDNFPRSGFETMISLTGLPPDTCFFQTKPVDAQGDPTPFSNTMFRADIPSCWEYFDHSYMPFFPK